MTVGTRALISLAAVLQAIPASGRLQVEMIDWRAHQDSLAAW
jgi:hypothetical protein